jgi:hypothetical protein
VITSRIFAISLVAIAFLYVIIMIYKAYKNVNSDQDESTNASEYYEYVSMSYDYRPYQSD